MRPCGTSPVILVVEDEHLVREMMCEELRAAGWEVLESSSAEAAVAYTLAQHRIDVVFTDIQLAGALSGWDLAEHLRARDPDFPIIYASGNSVDRSRRVAGSLFFDKPYRPAEIVEACRRLI